MQPHVARVESWIISVIGAGAVLTALLSLVGLVGAAARKFADPLLVADMPYGGAPVRRLEGVDEVTRSGYESVWIEVSGLPTGSRWLFFAEAVLPLLATLAISAAVIGLAFALLRSRPFARAVTNAIAVAAIAVMVGGIGAQALGAFARASVVDYLGVVEMNGSSNERPAEGLTSFALNLDLAPIGWAFGLALVAAAFQLGTRMQRDTEGLV